MRIEHIALYVQNLEGARDFFTTYLGASANAGYHNPNTGFRSYFLTFDDGARLELMTAPGLTDADKAPLNTGYAHLAFSLGSRQRVDELTQTLSQAGFQVVSGPRVTGDGYYESCVAGFENNRIELTV